MRLSLQILFTLLLAFFCASSAEAQSSDSLDCTTVEACKELIGKYQRDQKKLMDSLIAANSNQTGAAAPSELYDTYYKYQMSLYERDIEFHNIQTEAFRQQALHSWFSLVVISIIMAAGLIFAGVQLWMGLKYGKKVDASESSIKMGNLSFKSSILGVTVLFVWLLSYFIYVEKIYPIDTVEIMTTLQEGPVTEEKS